MIRLMCRDGLKSVTMERVAKEVGIAKGTVYLHYHDKQELLEAVKESALSPLTDKVDEALRIDAGPDRKLQAFSLRYLSYFDERRELFRILLYEREVTRVWGKRYQTGRYRHMVDRVSRVILEGVAARLFRNVDTNDAHTIAAMFVEANIAVVNQRLLAERPPAVDDDARLVTDLFLRGLGSDGVAAKARTRRLPRAAATHRRRSMQ